jgi:hypothetical protein
MYALTYVVPTVVFGFFLWRGRRDPVYILALPLLLGYGRSIFLDTYSLHLTVGGGVAVNENDLSLMALLVVFAYVRAIRPTASPERVSLQLYLCAGLLILLTAKAFAVGSQSWTDVASPSHLYVAAKAGAVARVWFYLPLSIMLWHLVLKRFSGHEILDLLRILTWVTVACCVVYFANLAGVKTYTSIWQAYSTTDAPGGVGVFRDYLFIPGWLNVALAYSLAQLVYGKERATYFPVAAIVTACALFTFTRSIGLCAVGLWVVAILWRAVVIPVRGRSTGRGEAIGSARVTFAMSVFASVFAAMVLRWSTLTAWWAYLGLRMGALSTGVTGDPNTAMRVSLLGRAAEIVSHEGFFLGTLMTSTGSAGGVYFLDSYWAAVLVSFGWLGLFLTGGLVVTALAEATLRGLRADAGSAILSLTILFGLLMTVVLSMTGAGWVAAATTGAFLLAAPDVRFRITPSPPSVAGPAGIAGR